MGRTPPEKDVESLLSALSDVLKAMEALAQALRENGPAGARDELHDVEHHELWYFALREKVFGPDGT